MSSIHIATKEEAIEKYKGWVADPEQEVEARREELSKLKKEDLIQMILEKESKKSNGMGIGELAKAILRDEELITLSNAEIAEVIRELVPGANTTNKSIASYISKKKDEWGLPPRIRISKS